jgi:multidrug resistance protein
MRTPSAKERPLTAGVPYTITPSICYLHPPVIAPPVDNDRASRAGLAVLLLTVFLDLVGFGMVIPILPLYAESMHATDVETGFLLAIYSMLQLVFSPIWGRLSDRVGRRPILLVSILGSCLSQLGFAFAPTFTWLVVARAVSGACGANITAAQAYIADVTDGTSRAAGMGMLGAALGLGFIFGPVAGGLLAQISPSAPFLVAGCLAGLNFALALVTLKEPRTAAERSQSRALTWSALVRAVTTPRLLTLVVLFFVVTFGFANLESTFSLYLERRFGFGRRETSFIFAFIGVIMIVVQGVLVRRYAPRVGERRLVIAGTGLMAIGFFVQSFADTLPLLLLAVAIVSIGNGLNTPSLSSLVSRAASGREQGGVLGVNQAAGALARIIGPLVGTFALGFGDGAPYMTGGAVLLAACGFAVLAIEQPER